MYQTIFVKKLKDVKPCFMLYFKIEIRGQILHRFHVGLTDVEISTVSAGNAKHLTVCFQNTQCAVLLEVMINKTTVCANVFKHIYILLMICVQSV